MLWLVELTLKHQLLHDICIKESLLVDECYPSKCPQSAQVLLALAMTGATALEVQS